MSQWRDLEKGLDALVDSVWDEPVEFHPWGLGGLSTDPGPDPTRSVLKTRGVLMMPGATASGEGGTPGAVGFPGGIVTARFWISITEYNIGDLSVWNTQNDRVYLPERDWWFTIQSILPSATARPNVYLDRLNVDNP